MSAAVNSQNGRKPELIRGPFVIRSGDRTMILCQSDHPVHLKLRCRQSGETQFRETKEPDRNPAADHAVRFPWELTPDTLYELFLVDTDSGENLNQTVFRFRTSPASPSPILSGGPYLFRIGKGRAWLTWKTRENTCGGVEYRPVNSSEILQKWEQDGGVPEYRKRHILELDRLQFGTDYEYRILSRDLQTNSMVCETPFRPLRIPSEKPAVLRFVFFSDIHADLRTFEKLIAATRPEKTDFAVLGGDNCWDGIYTPGEQCFFEDFLNTASLRFAATVPTLFLRGNHEWNGQYAGDWMDWFPNPGRKTYDSFRLGDAYFIILDTGPIAPAPDSAAGKYLKEQRDWLVREIFPSPEFKTARFRIVLAHMPTHGIPNGPLLEKLFAPLFNQEKIHVMLVGHVHRYMRIDPGAKGCWGTDYYRIWNESEPPRSAEDKKYVLLINGGGPDDNGFWATAVNGEITREYIRLSVMDSNGKTVDDFKIRPDGSIENLLAIPFYPYRGKY